jgi:hypothetical protein
MHWPKKLEGFYKIWFDKFFLAYVKYERSNLDAMIVALKWVVDCETLGVNESFQSTHFGHVFSKASTSDERMCKGIRYVSIKSV